MRMLICGLACLFCVGAGPMVALVRCPNDGVQPQAAVEGGDRRGR
jgi:hypothetical protein